MTQIMTGGKELVWNYFRKVVAVNREFIGEEAGEVKALAHLVMERWDTGKRWTQTELKEFRMHFKNAIKIIYALAIFLLPGGLFLLPFVAGWLHRSKG